MKAIHRLAGQTFGALIAATSVTTPAAAQSPTDVETATSTPDLQLTLPENIVVLGRPINSGRIAGSAHRLDAKALSDFEYDDILRVLTKVPGVYVRDEDGFGLRPNIGLRGANSDRSSRVVLMEDDILLGPAPYAAPAAYYTPLTTRMDGIDIFKGPAAIQYGPYTVGGAINYRTAPIPTGHGAVADVAVGQFGYGKLHGRYGWGGENFGFLIEGVRLTSTGFKEIDADEAADTGFTRNEFMVKARLNSDTGSRVYHRFDVKLGYSDEGSNETYLGLTDEDFDDNPFRRYRASQLARMEWQRTQLQASYTMVVDEDFRMKLVAYRHDFTRAWLKLNRFRNLTASNQFSVNDVLQNPTGGIEELLLQIARGEAPSGDIDNDAPRLLGIGTNDRTFVSQGVQLIAEAKFGSYPLVNTLQMGARLHYDEIRRRHDEAPYAMVVTDGQPGMVERVADIAPTRSDNESALAVSLFLLDEMTIFEDLVLTPGARVEIISTQSEDLLAAAQGMPTGLQTSDDVIFVPGFGAYYQLMDWLGVLAGVHRGFSPVAPGQEEEIEPELSWNYEAGVRLQLGRSRVELIGFVSDYTNLLLTCTFSQACADEDLGRQFNAGDVSVVGLEASIDHQQRLGPVLMRLNVAYTLTDARFQSSFTSGSPQFEEVDVDDRLPYLPIHQANVSVGADVAVFSVPVGLLVAYTFVDRMRNEASQGDVPNAELTDVQHIVDATLHAELFESSRLYLRVDNLLNQEYIASRRPFGARPGKPFHFQMGFTYQFGD